MRHDHPNVQRRILGGESVTMLPNRDRERSLEPGDRRALRVAFADIRLRAAAASHADASGALNQLLTPLAPYDREYLHSGMAQIVVAGQRGTAIGQST